MHILKYCLLVYHAAVKIKIADSIKQTSDCRWKWQGHTRQQVSVRTIPVAIFITIRQATGINAENKDELL